MNYTTQLSCSGVPSAFDLHPSKEHLVVASPGCLTFFKLNGLGTPRHVIHYEQPQQVRQIKYQRQGGALLSVLRAGVVSLWEPAKALRPLIGHIKSQGGWISDMAWSPSNGNLLATSCDGGHVSIWDVRSPLWPTQQVTADGVCYCVDWCPTNANLLSVVASSGQRLIVFDSRMVGSRINVTTSNSSSSGAGGTEVPGELGDGGEAAFTVSSGSYDFVTAIEVECGITHASWCGANTHTSPSSSAALILGTVSGRLEYWDIQTGVVDGAGPSNPQSSQFANLGSQTGAALVDSESLVLATPVGRGAVICRRQNLSSGHNEQRLAAGLDSARTRGAAGPGSSSSGGCNRSSSSLVIRLQGCPRDSLLNVFSPPDQRSSKGLEYGPSIELAQVSSSPILGMLWGAPGRLIPPVHGGLELLVLTESASLTAIRIPQDVIRKYCFSGGGSSKSDLASITLEKARSRENMALEPARLAAPTNATLIAPRYPLSFLKSSKDQEFNSESAPNKKKKGSSKVVVQAASVDRGGDRFWAGIRGEVLALEDAVQREQLHGLIIGRIDQYARQVTLEMEIPRLRASPTPHDRNPPKDVQAAAQESERILALILRYPSRGIPSFTLRGLEGAEESAFGAALSAELDSIAREHSSDAFAGGEPRSKLAEDGFLLAVAHCFRDRCIRPLAYRPRFHKDDEEHADGLARDGTDASGKAAAAPVVSDVIDPIAYRVPSPACSGARWSSKGVLLCFGGATVLQASLASARTERDEVTYPKSLGDMLIMERAREEAYAQQMQHLKLLPPQGSPEGQDGSGAEDDSGSDAGSSDSDEEDAGLVDEGAVDEFGNVIYSIRSARRRRSGQAAAGGRASAGTFASSSASAISSSSSRYLGLDDHLLPLAHQGQTLESLGEDLDLIAKAEARTAGFRRTLPSGVNNERALWLAEVAAASSSGIVSSSPSHLEFYTALPLLPQILAEQYSLGPLPISASAADPSMSFHDVKARADACRHNADLVAKIVASTDSKYPYSALQIWSLLAVSLDLYAAAQDNPDGLASEGGAMLRWSENVLGSSLLRQIIIMLAEYQELQLMATCVCILGGSTQTIALLQSQQGQSGVGPDFRALKRLLDRAMSCYTDILCRWGALAKAAEVVKHRGGTKDDNSRCLQSAGVTCNEEQVEYPPACSICESSMHGSFFYCSTCGHGGHAAQVRGCPGLVAWFERSVDCPTGCGCRCVSLLERDTIKSQRYDDDDGWVSESDSDDDDYSSSGSSGSEIISLF